jgi:predicted O-methyltransferase YrrM
MTTNLGMTHAPYAPLAATVTFVDNRLTLRDRPMDVHTASEPGRQTPGVSAPPELPDIVRRALDVSRSQGFVSATRHETGRLLATLAAMRRGTLAELGTGCGVGAAWLSSGADSQVRIVTAEVDPRLADLARDVFTDDQRVEVYAGDWTALEQFAPFSLLFVDVREVKRGSVDVIADLMEPGGVVVLDDFTPSTQWPPTYHGRVDEMRERWLTDERFIAVDVMVTDDASVVLAARR